MESSNQPGGYMRALATFVCLMLVTACQAAPPAEMTEAEIAQFAAEVTEVMEANLEGWRQGNVDMIMGTFHPTATAWVWGSVPRDYARVRELTENWFNNNEFWDGGWTETTVKVLSPDAAVFQGHYRAEMHYTDGRILNWPGNASWTNLMERTEDGWKVTMGANAARNGRRIDQLYGTYDWEILGGQTLPSDSLTSGWLEWRPDGSFTSYEILADGSGTIELHGQSTIGQFVDDCFQFEAWLDESPEASFSGTICDDEVTGDDGNPFVGHKRG